MENHRAIFISDVHIGSRQCRAGVLLGFLTEHTADTIYLVGDIIDGWALRRSWYWEPTYNKLINLILARNAEGVKIIYLKGNHDEFLRRHEIRVGGIEFVESVVHMTVYGKRMLVIHGDIFDGGLRYARFGYRIYQIAKTLDIKISALFGIRRWSLSDRLKRWIESVTEYMSAFTDKAIEEAKHHNTTMVLCGHTHRPEIREIDGITYLNSGDWVEHCSAIVENRDGTLELIYS